LIIRDLAGAATFSAPGRLPERVAVAQERDLRAVQDLATLLRYAVPSFLMRPGLESELRITNAMIHIEPLG
jgi:hypothetical protein